MTNLEDLLRRHAEGTLTPDQQAELNLLTHREQVVQAATLRASQIRRRRNTSFAAVASVLLVAGSIFFTRPSADSLAADMPVVAKTEVPSVDIPISEVSEAKEVVAPALLPTSTVETKIGSIASEPMRPVRSRQAEVPESTVDLNQMAPEVINSGDAIVACNTQCSPDSVINDIWNFLRA